MDVIKVTDPSKTAIVSNKEFDSYENRIREYVYQTDLITTTEDKDKINQKLSNYDVIGDLYQFNNDNSSDMLSINGVIMVSHLYMQYGIVILRSLLNSTKFEGNICVLIKSEDEYRSVILRNNVTSWSIVRVNQNCIMLTTTKSVINEESDYRSSGTTDMYYIRTAQTDGRKILLEVFRVGRFMDFPSSISYCYEDSSAIVVVLYTKSYRFSDYVAIAITNIGIDYGRLIISAAEVNSTVQNSRAIMSREHVDLALEITGIIEGKHEEGERGVEAKKEKISDLSKKCSGLIIYDIFSEEAEDGTIQKQITKLSKSWVQLVHSTRITIDEVKHE